MDIWAAVKNETFLSVLSGELIRVVESQEQIATNQLVDNFEEQIQLEEMLEQSKPRLSQQIQERLSYLLTTSFRYPPLAHGSRFGSRFEPSLFYASKSQSTAFSETAFYRFYFWRGMATQPPSGKFLTEHTVFTATYYSANGLSLNKMPFFQFEKQLRHPQNYQTTQTLGNNMRENKIDIFEYTSARDTNKGTNVALFNASVFSCKKPTEQQQWLCETTSDKIAFSSKEGILFRFRIKDFLFNNTFPLPAA